MDDLLIQWLTGGAAALVLSAAVRALPEPLPMGGRFYLWFYRFTQGLLANPDLSDKFKPGKTDQK